MWIEQVDEGCNVLSVKVVPMRCGGGGDFRQLLPECFRAFRRLSGKSGRWSSLHGTRRYSLQCDQESSEGMDEIKSMG
jgi:hypothetical protein